MTCCSLARICSYQCDIYLTCGHFGLKWHPPRNFVHRFMQRRGTPGHRGVLATSSCIVLGHSSQPAFSISVCCSFVLGFFTGLSVLFWLLLLLWMSDSSSDTTHEAILHNVIRHQRRFAQQLQQLQTSVDTLQQQLSFIQGQLQTLLTSHGRPIQSAAPPSDCKKDQDQQ